MPWLSSTRAAPWPCHRAWPASDFSWSLLRGRLQPAVQRTPVYTKNPGCTLLVSPGRRHHPAHVILLQGCQRGPLRQISRVGLCHPANRATRVLTLAHPFRQMLRLDGITVTEGYRPLDGAGQLPDIPRERVIAQDAQRHLTESDQATVVTLPGLIEEMHGQQFHIFAPVPQGGHPQGQGFKTIVQILAEITGRYGFLQVDVSRRQHPDIDAFFMV